ncbi:MAG: hypothetical protein ACLR7Z_13105 [Bilophila wadsworthia]
MVNQALPQPQSELFGYDEGFTGVSRLKARQRAGDNGPFFLMKSGRCLKRRSPAPSAPERRSATREANTPASSTWVSPPRTGLENAIRQNAFREDLYYRLNVFTSTCLLRERSSTSRLINHFDHFVASWARPLAVTAGGCLVARGPATSVS